MDAVEHTFDPVREPGLGRRLALLGVVVGVMAVFPVYALLLGLNLTGTLFVLAPGVLAGLSTIVGIEVVSIVLDLMSLNILDLRREPAEEPYV